MATVYEVEVVSHWINYTKEDLQEILKKALIKVQEETSNEITIEVKKKIS